MDRKTWLRKMQEDCEEQYDMVWASLYSEEKAGTYNNKTHLTFILEFLSLLSPRSKILDAACGVGRYLPYLLKREHSIIGIDQSQGMLTEAKAKFPNVQFEKVSLQQMSYQEDFDGVICVDAMENVCPEDWPIVLANFNLALKKNGYLYLTTETIEKADEKEIQKAYQRGHQAGIPIVYGENPDEGVYHYHPSTHQVKTSVQQAGFKIVKEGDSVEWYYHTLMIKID